MKRVVSNCWTGFLALVLLAGFCGCATAGKSLASTVQTVDAAMQGWMAYVVLANPDPVAENKVRAAYEKYQAAEAVAEKAYLHFVKTGDRSGWDVASGFLRGTQKELLTLIEELKQ